MIRRPARLVLVLAALALLPALAACATAPATGKTIFTGGLSQEDEARLGRQAHEKILARFGGAYDDPGLTAYISSIGKLLASTSELPALVFTFTVLDTPIVNAFALPGGYVYLTRGLLALADDEAEVAGVLAHEIGHVTARHSAERYGQAMAAKLATAGLGLLLGSGPATDAFGTVSALALRSFTREQEHEADVLGVRYLARSGYDPRAMSSFLERLLAHSRLDAELKGKPGRADEFNIMQTHPRTADRIRRAIQEAGAKAVADPMTARAIYLGKIDGMLYGDSPAQGFVRGRSFVHPRLRFSFRVPAGFRLFNSPLRVVARGPDGAAILFDRARTASRAGMVEYLTQDWAKDLGLSDVEAITVNGMAAATGRTRLNTRGGQRDIRLLAIRYDAKTIYRMLFVTPPSLTAALGRPFRETTYSFRKLSQAEAARLRPLRLRIHDPRPGDTVAGLAARMPFEDHRMERFLVLNGLHAGGPLPPGRKVKIVTE
ncbi:MAG: M48 family metalloprotease [Kiloniellaceae bacterium]